MRRILSLFVAVVALSATAKVHIEIDSDNLLLLKLDGKSIVTAPKEGLWSVATGWSEDWMCDWHHSSPERIEQIGEWSVVHGKIALAEGELHLRDSYREVAEGLVQCIRRYEWHGDSNLEHTTLSV